MRDVSITGFTALIDGGEDYNPELHHFVVWGCARTTSHRTAPRRPGSWRRSAHGIHCGALTEQTTFCAALSADAAGRPARALSGLVRSAQQAKGKRCRCVVAQPRLPELRQWPGRLRLWLGAWCVAPLPNRQRNLSAAPIELSLAAPVCQSSVGCLNGVFFTIRCKGNRAAERRGDQARAGRHTIVRPKSAVLHWADCNP